MKKIQEFIKDFYEPGREAYHTTLRGKFLGAFLVISIATTGLILVLFLLDLLSTSNQSALFPILITALLGILFLVTWMVAQRRSSRVLAYITLTLVIAGISLILGRQHYQAFIGLYAVPILIAGFLVTPVHSIFTGMLALLAYSLEYFTVLRGETPYDFFVFIIVVFPAFIGWYVSRSIEITHTNVQALSKTYKTLIDQTPGVIYIKELYPAPHFTYVSPQIESLLGITPQEWLSNPEIRRDRLYPDDVERVNESNRLALTGRTQFKEEYRIYTKSGKLIWVSDYAVSQIENGKVVSQQGLITEVTDRKKSEKVQSVILKISEAVSSSKDLDDLFQFIHQSMGELMPVDNFYFAIYEPDENLLYFPYFVDQVDQYSEPYPPGKGLTEYVMRTKKPLLASPDELQHLVELGEVERVGSPSLDWLGVPLIVEGKTIGVMAVQTYKEGIRFSQIDLDVLNAVSSTVAMVIYRKRIEDKLLESEQMYRTLVGASPDVIIEMDREGIIRYVSPQAKDIFHLKSEDQVIGTSFYDWVVHADQSVIRRQFSKVIRNKPVRNVSFQFMDAEGGKLIGECNTGLLTDSEGKVTGLVTVMRDITERKKAEDQLKEALQEKEILLKEVHHRVKNNLQIMSSLLSIQEEKIEDLSAKNALKNAQSRIRSMAYIHEDLYQTSHLAYVDLNLYMRKLVQNLLDLYSMGKQVTTSYQIDSSHIGLDTAIPCGLIVNELVSNSLKYAFPDKRAGTIAVRFFHDKSLRRSNQYTLEVEDNGIGFTDSGKQQEESSRKLGFQLVQILAKQLNGTVQIDRTSGVRISITFNSR